MKKVINVILCIAVAMTLISCSSSPKEDTNSTDFVWTREGYFEDGDGDTLMIYKSETEGYEGWSVGLYNEELAIGWIIQQEGITLHGDLISEYDESGGHYVVTISEEGEDGVMMVDPDGVEHHFKPMELPEIIGTVFINIDGMGEITYAYEGEEIKFDDEYPFQSSVINLMEPTTLTIGARAAEDYKFVKWTLNGEDYTSEEIFTVELSSDADFVAVFEYVG